MKTTWDLTVFYNGFDDPAFLADMGALPGMIDDFSAAIRAESDDPAAKIRGLIEKHKKIDYTLNRVAQMTQLTLSCDAESDDANAAMAQLMRIFMTTQQAMNAFSRYLASIESLESVIAGDEMLQRNAFALLDAAASARHMLPEALEEPVLRMQLSGGEMFSQLRDKLDATLTACFDGEEIPLSAARAKAYDPDPEVRRRAYEAEIACYAKIELPMSYCLNAIKAEAQTMAKLKGYDGVLDMTLHQSRMEKETLDAMWTAIREALPELRNYWKAKAKLLGHKDGLPFYDLFAPVGESARTYTIEEARDLLLRVFTAFCPDMGEMMKTAFDEGWIDVYPRPGKSGGAFCSGCHEKNISRIMTNFAGSLSDVSTLAHELGHAYNNRMLARVPVMMTDTPMPLAETASTFNETLMNGVLRKGASIEEELMLLDSSLTENLQTMVDIYSRFLFEQKVVESQDDHALSVRELKEAMLWAQEQSYGDGLNAEIRHPYMWACKSHYYSTGMHFYNFPYAFGGLFGRGLYAQYEEKGEAFVPVYGDLLSRFGSGTIEDVAASVGIDVRSLDFWRSAVGSVVEEVRRFVQLVDKKLGA